MQVQGACHCGYITIEGDADPEKVTVCHCTDCQTGTGSAFRNSVPVAGNTFKMTGKPRLQTFCPKCGTPIYSTTVGDGVQPSYTVRVGILKQRDQLPPKRQQWMRSARPWTASLGALPKHEKQVS
jgi:hypothetical protein